MTLSSSSAAEPSAEYPLPVFVHSVTALEKITGGVKVQWEEIGDIILKDPGLMLQILQELKSGSKRSRGVEVTDMAQAAMLLGLNRIKNLMPGLPRLEELANEQTRIGYTRAANRAFHAAYQAWDWAQVKRDSTPNEFLVATLLNNIAELTLWISAPEKMHQVRMLVYKDGVAPDAAQYISLGESLEHYSRAAVAKWALPALVGDALRPENARLPRVQGVVLAVRLADAVEYGWYTSQVLKVMESIAAYIGKPLDQTIARVHRAAVRAAHESPFRGVRSAAALLALIPNDEDDLVADDFPGESARKNSGESGGVVKVVSDQAVESADLDREATRPYQVADISVNKSTIVCLSPQLLQLKKAVRELEAGVERFSIDEIMRRVVHAIHDGAGLNRVVFVVPVKNHPVLEARFMVGTDNDPMFNRFQIRTVTPNLFSRLLEKPQSVWINDDNRKSYWPLVPSDFKVLIKVNSFCAMSVHVDAKPIGLFYADRQSPDCKIDQHTYSLFRQLCLVATKSLVYKIKGKR